MEVKIWYAGDCVIEEKLFVFERAIWGWAFSKETTFFIVEISCKNNNKIEGRV